MRVSLIEQIDTKASVDQIEQIIDETNKKL